MILFIFKNISKKEESDLIQDLKDFGIKRKSSDRGLICFRGECKDSKMEMDAIEIYDKIYTTANEIYIHAEKMYGEKEIIESPKIALEDLNNLGTSLLLRSLPSIRDSLLLEIIQVNSNFGGFCKSLTTFTMNPDFDKMDLWFPLSKFAGLLVNGTSLQDEQRIIAISKRDLNSKNSILQPNCGFDKHLNKKNLLSPSSRSSFDIASQDIESRKTHKSKVMAANEILADISSESIVGILIIPSEVSYSEVLLIQKANSIMTYYFGHPQKFGNIYSIVNNNLFAINNKNDYDYATKMQK
jgi:hypothetical protein